MSENCGHDCGSCGADCPSRKTASLREELNPLSSVKKVIAVVSGKGGVGKSLVTALLAVKLRREGYQTAILDADITGPSIPKMFGITARAQGTEQGIFPEKSALGIDLMSINLLLENAADPVLWRGPMIAGVVKQFWSNVIWHNIDCMLVDMPPGTGDVPLTVYQSLPVDGIVVVATPQELVEMIVAKAIKMAEMMNVPILGLVENMSYVACPDCGKKITLFGESHVESLAQQLGLRVLAKIPVDPQLAEACDAGKIETYPQDFFGDHPVLPC
ncbi:MAG: Mrp/NBP35 family ATP-binding protein [Planctomycetia bacterium]|nr:Mrp/NBP35 family ATP-binding protein [Planctomycetia bacterium]